MIQLASTHHATNLTGHEQRGGGALAGAQEIGVARAARPCAMPCDTIGSGSKGAWPCAGSGACPGTATRTCSDGTGATSSGMAPSKMTTWLPRAVDGGLMLIRPAHAFSDSHCECGGPDA